jgi:energy-coupling factor transport system permease protein
VLSIAAGSVAYLGVVVSARVDPASLRMPLYPLDWPSVPIAASLGAVVALLPAFIAPRPAPPSPAVQVPVARRVGAQA